jgi:heme-degrading monooxygenase HmoA
VFIRVWRFRAAPGKELEFERFNGPNGEWTRLFEQAPGYLGTFLKPIKRSPGEYQIVDRWESREAWDVFRRDYSHAYEQLDREAESLTASETFVAEEELVPFTSRRELITMMAGGTLLWLGFAKWIWPGAVVLERIGLSLFAGLALAAMTHVMTRFVMPPMFRLMAKLHWRWQKKKAAGDRSPAAH